MTTRIGQYTVKVSQQVKAWLADQPDDIQRIVSAQIRQLAQCPQINDEVRSARWAHSEHGRARRLKITLARDLETRIGKHGGVRAIYWIAASIDIDSEGDVLVVKVDYRCNNVYEDGH